MYIYKAQDKKKKVYPRSEESKPYVLGGGAMIMIYVPSACG